MVTKVGGFNYNFKSNDVPTLPCFMSDHALWYLRKQMYRDDNSVVMITEIGWSLITILKVYNDFFNVPTIHVFYMSDHALIVVLRKTDV